MERLNKIFKTENKIISIFFTAGYPKLNLVKSLCELLEKSGVNMIEIGIPSSDPLADGPVIQHSSTIALENKMTMNILFKELNEIRKTVNIPILLMGYYNQVLQFGAEKFIDLSKQVGVDGFIIPDQQIDSDFQKLCNKNQLANVRMITPTTSMGRIKLIDENCTGFLYAVSSSSTTGNNQHEVSTYLEKLQQMNLQNKIITGFGIKDKISYDLATKNTNGGIIGSAFVNFIADDKNINQEKINEFVSQFKN